MSRRAALLSSKAAVITFGLKRNYAPPAAFKNLALTYQGRQLTFNLCLFARRRAAPEIKRFAELLEAKLKA